MMRGTIIAAIVMIVVLVVGGLIVAVSHGLKGKGAAKIGSIFAFPEFEYVPTPMPRSVQPAVVSRSGSVSGSSPRSVSSGRSSVQPPDGFTVGQLSPFYGLVSVGSVRSVRPSWEQAGFFRISATPSLKNPVSITGWRVETNEGGVHIPKGISNYRPLSYAEGDIVIGPRGIVNVYGNKNVVGHNFRLNRCTGYLNNIYSFRPVSLPKSCPREVVRGDITSFSGRCQSFLLSVGSGCREPSSREINSFIGDQACMDYMRGLFGYGNCYERHHRDSGFFSNTWYVWLGERMLFLDDLHDRVLLFDRDGLLVDEYVY